MIGRKSEQKSVWRIFKEVLTVHFGTGKLNVMKQRNWKKQTTKIMKVDLEEQLKNKPIFGFHRNILKCLTVVQLSFF